jgi:hypothetical protein
MPKRTSELHKHTLNLYEGDMERMCLAYPDIGGSAAIRTIIHNHLEKVESQVEKPTVLPSIDLEDLLPAEPTNV